MSFAGHALDMIKRLKEGREPLNRRREQTKGKGKGIHVGRGNQPQNITAEEFDRINKAVKEREQEHERYFVRMTLILGCVAIVLAALVCFVIEVFFS